MTFRRPPYSRSGAGDGDKADRDDETRRDPILSGKAPVSIDSISRSTPLSALAPVGPVGKALPAQLAGAKAPLRRPDDDSARRRPVFAGNADNTAAETACGYRELHETPQPFTPVEIDLRKKTAPPTRPAVPHAPTAQPADLPGDPPKSPSGLKRTRGRPVEAAKNAVSLPLLKSSGKSPVKSAIVDKRAPICKSAETPDGVFQSAMEMGRTRLLITATVMTLAFGVIGARLVDVATLQSPTEPKVASSAAQAAPVGAAIEGGRAAIVDRNGVLLATNLPTVSLFADPSLVINPRETAYRLSSILPDLDPEAVEAKLRRKTQYVRLARSLTPQQHYDVNMLGLPGVAFTKGATRLYPHGPLFSHILGYTNIDNKGISGLEHRFDKALREEAEPIRLSVDARVQHVLRDELRAAMQRFSAIGAAGVVMDVRNGEILGMASLPDFDPNHPTQSGPEQRFNRAAKGVYELGSTFKIFNTAMALDGGVVRLQDRYDATKPLRVGRHTITDYHAENRWLTIPEIFIHSSNIGSAKMALDVGGPEQKAFLKKLGFLDRLAVELPEVSTPLAPRVWREINTVTISYGHGLSVSPLHLTSGVAAMINGGVMHRPTLVKTHGAPAGERVIGQNTSDAIRVLMRLNALEGSGKSAAVHGYAIGGKTGTAEKPGSGGYNRKKLISSFIGAFPMHAPRYAVYVVLDEPKGTAETHNFATGGWVAAPSVGHIIEAIAPILGVQPVEEEAPALQQQLATVAPQSGATLASLRQ
ncbi:MAG: penicillin-binding transpeptidase domain-containing protein [Alphaproteobacteria bacterium]|nr:penicillin-binding transpeptidase domain-containing protein [Alphaproteobacteria bacterium]